MYTSTAFCHTLYHILFLDPCRCWLNPYTHFVWTFIVPVLVVLLVNVGFFIMVLVIMNRHAKTRTKTNKARYIVDREDHCSLTN